MKFFKQLFDAPTEIVIAHGRVVLVAFSLAAITIDPTRPLYLAPLVAGTLMMYAAYAVVLLAALHRRLVHNVNVRLVHIADLATVALLLVLTDGLSSPFLVFFTFALLAASLRWDWRGIAATMVVLFLIAGMVAAFDGSDGHLLNLNQTLIRGAYLIATGTILTYASAHREHERNRLAKLAQSPAALSTGDVSGPLAETLKQAVSVMEASRALVVWGEDDRKFNAAIWHDGKFEALELTAGAPAVVVAPEMEGLTFSRTVPDLDRLNLVNGSVRSIPDVLRGELLPKLDIRDFSSSPFRGLAASGRLFILGNIHPSDDHLPITRIIAERVGTELDRQIYLERATRDAATRERAVIMRDLHDSLLQSLTAARAHLELLPADAEKAKAQLRTVRELLQMEQRRVREFVDATHAMDRETVAIEMLRSRVEDSARLWGCTVSLTLNPPSATVSRKKLNQLSLMLAESVANAVRHGEATKVDVMVTCRDSLLEIEVHDDGCGFTGVAATTAPTEVAEAELPRSLNTRLRELGGQLRAHTSISGTVLRLELST
jgi:signal transduction histidine kinase